MRARRRVYNPQAGIPADAIGWHVGAKRQHGTIQKCMTRRAGKPVQKISKHICRNQIEFKALRIEYPDLLTVIARAINCQIAIIRRELHEEDTIRLKLTEAITKCRYRLRTAKRLPAAPFERTRQDKAVGMLERVV